MKTCFLFPHVTVDIRAKRVYEREKLPYPGANCPCTACSEAWMSKLFEKFGAPYVDGLR